MSFGLQLWDNNNNLILDTSLTMARVVQIGTTSSTTVSVPGMVDDGTWFVFGLREAEGFNQVAFSIGNGCFSWSGAGPINYYVFRAALV